MKPKFLQDVQRNVVVPHVEGHSGVPAIGGMPIPGPYQAPKLPMNPAGPGPVSDQQAPFKVK